MSTEYAPRDQILALAGQVGNPDTPPEETARNRGWLDADGEPTQEGIDVLENLADQAGTRSAFR